MADKKSFVLYNEYKEHFALLPAEDQGHLLMAIFEYVEEGTEPVLSPAAMMAFSFIRLQLDRDGEKYAETCERRAEAGKRSGESRRNKTNKSEQTGTKGTSVHFVQQNEQTGTKRTDNDNEDDNENDIIIPPTPLKRGTGFQEPTVEEVKAYCKQRNNHVDAEEFVSFYASKGWLVGNQPMRDWRAAVCTWEKRKVQLSSRASPKNSFTGYAQHTDSSFSIEDISFDREQSKP